MKRTKEEFSAGGEVSTGYGSPSWCRGQLLGRGGFGSVFIAKLKEPCWRFPSIMAVKSENAASAPSSLMKEELVLQALKGCPNVVQSFGSDITTTNLAEGLRQPFKWGCSASGRWGLKLLPEKIDSGLESGEWRVEREEKTAVIKHDGGRLGSTIAGFWSPVILPGERGVTVRIERVQREES